MGNEIKLLGNIYGEQFGTGYAGNVWDKNGICPTLTCTGDGGGRTPSIVEFCLAVREFGKPNNIKEK